MKSPWDLSKDAYAELLKAEPSYRVGQVWDGLYQQGLEPRDITNLPLGLRELLTRELKPSLECETTQRAADDTTIKHLWRLSDGAKVESVLMHYPERSTVCISSQAGCSMACGFCATGQAGFERNLSVGEILEQVVLARAEALPRRLSNVVFMGMGEPLANYNRVIEATHRIIGDLGLAARKITISTVGLAPQIARLADEGLQVGLAISLHAANDQLRSELVPINRRHPIDELVRVSRYFRETTGRRVSFEWAMMAGVNDSMDDAAELAVVAKEANAHVNLIPLNPTPGWPTVGTALPQIKAFAASLDGRGVNTTIRANRGNDIDAACGQLRAGHDAVPVSLGRVPQGE